MMRLPLHFTFLLPSLFSSSRATSIHDLPYEILSNVFSSLNVVDYVNFVEATSIRVSCFDERKLFLQTFQERIKEYKESIPVEESLISLLKLMIESCPVDEGDESFFSDLLQRIFESIQARNSKKAHSIVNEASSQTKESANYIKALLNTLGGREIIDLAYGGELREDLLQRSAKHGNLPILDIFGELEFFEKNFELVTDALIPLQSTNESSDFLVEKFKSSVSLTNRLTILFLKKDNFEAIVKYVDLNSIEAPTASDIGSCIVKGEVSERILEYILETFRLSPKTGYIFGSILVSNHYMAIQEKVMNEIFCDPLTSSAKINIVLKALGSKTGDVENLFHRILIDKNRDILILNILDNRYLHSAKYFILQEIAKVNDIELLKMAISHRSSKPHIVDLIKFMTKHHGEVFPFLLHDLSPMDKRSLVLYAMKEDYVDILRQFLEINEISLRNVLQNPVGFKGLEYIIQEYILLMHGTSTEGSLKHQLKAISFNLTKEMITLSEADYLIHLLLSTQPSIQDFKYTFLQEYQVTDLLLKSEILKTPPMHRYYEVLSEWMKLEGEIQSHFVRKTSSKRRDREENEIYSMPRKSKRPIHEYKSQYNF